MLQQLPRLARIAAGADTENTLGSEAERIAYSELLYQFAMGVADSDALRHRAVDAVRAEVRRVKASLGLRGSGSHFARYWSAPVDPEDPRISAILEALAVQQSLARLAPEEQELLELLGQHRTGRATARALGRGERQVQRQLRAAIARFLEVYNDDR